MSTERVTKINGSLKSAEHRINEHKWLVKRRTELKAKLDESALCEDLKKELQYSLDENIGRSNHLIELNEKMITEYERRLETINVK